MSIFQGFGRAIHLLTGGAVSAQVPNNAVTGGNARGNNSVDMQTTRTAASQVASGIQSTISGGANNTAAGSGSWIPGGTNASTRSDIGRGAWASGQFAVVGDAQAGDFALRRQTTDATPTRLTQDNAVAGLTNTVNLPDNSAYILRVLVVGRQNTAGGGRLAIQQSVLITRDVGAATTAAVVGTAETLSSGTVVGWAVAFTADTTNGSLAITVTGAAATTINWFARVLSAEVIA